jgi:curved DNA-binding protein CbpA
LIDLYEELGVSIDADEKTIRAAYRRRSKETHPDAGGDAEKFARTQTELAVLTDPVARRRYDETGEIDEKPVDNARAEAIGLIDAEFGPLVNDFIAKGFRPQDDPRSCDVVDIIKVRIAGRIAADQRMIEIGRKAVAFYADMSRRMRLKKKKAAAENPLARRFDDLVRESEKSLASGFSAAAFFFFSRIRRDMSA